MNLRKCKFELEKMIAQLEQIGVDLPEALGVCLEVFKDNLKNVTSELEKLGPIRAYRGPILSYYPDSIQPVSRTVVSRSAWIMLCFVVSWSCWWWS